MDIFLDLPNIEVTIAAEPLVQDKENSLKRNIHVRNLEDEFAKVRA